MQNIELLEAVKIALPIFAEHKNSWDNLTNALDNSEIPHSLTDSLLEFMPLAFGRVLLDGMGIEFSNFYVRFDAETGRKQKKLFIDNSVYQELFEVASYIVTNKMAGEAFTAVALRSSEVMSVNDLLKKGSNPKDLVLSPPYMQWDENDGLEVKNERSWRRFWK
jgi:hypothetical protein